MKKYGSELFYIETGSGFPLILLHGNGEESSYFKNQTEVFSKKFRVIAVDTRGHGKSPRGNGAFTLERFAEDLDVLMRELDISRANILGFSDGGNIALLFSLSHPEKVNKLILNGANLSPLGVKLSVQLPIIAEYAAMSIFALFDKRALRRKELLSLMVCQPNIPVSELKTLTMETLVLAGDNDMIKANHTRKIALSIPNARLCVIPGSHFIAAENSELYNAEVLDFLEK